MKSCRGCLVAKDESEFYKNRANKDGLFSVCKNCHASRCKEWKRANPERVAAIQLRWDRANPDKRKANNTRWASNNLDKYRTIRRGVELKYRYGITLSDYDALLESQGGVCAICGGAERSGRPLYVDHCHATGKVRGLLCNLCNKGLGHFRDKVSTVLLAASYLSRHGS